MKLPAISLWQPWATLCATPQPCAGYQYGDDSSCRCSRMVKRYETRSRPCPAKHVGQRIAIHASRRAWPGGGIQHIGDYTFYVGRDRAWMARTDDLRYAKTGPITIDLPRGAVVAKAVGAASLSMCEYEVPVAEVGPGGRDEWCPHGDGPHVCIESWADGRRALTHWARDVDDEPDEATLNIDITDQDEYGDWSADVESVDPPVPWKGRQGWFQVELP